MKVDKMAKSYQVKDVKKAIEKMEAKKAESVKWMQEEGETVLTARNKILEPGFCGQIRLLPSPEAPFSF